VTAHEPEPFSTIIENAMRDDAAYFEARPAARSYVRQPRRGEFWPAHDPAPYSRVIVQQLAPGVRVRRVVYGILIHADGSEELVSL